jgi:flavorubredoxin
MTSSPAASADRRVIVLPLEPGLVCLRGLSPKRLRFEVEYGLERGTCHNSFLFAGSPAVLVHPPGEAFAAPFLGSLRQLVPQDQALTVVLGDVNPNRVALLQQLLREVTLRKLRNQLLKALSHLHQPP